MTKRKAIFWDRDGVINKIIVDSDGYQRSPRLISELELLPRVAEAMIASAGRGYLNVIATNQPEVIRGLIAAAELEAIHERLRQELPVDGIMVCLHDTEDACSCRKPEPGLLFAAAERWNIDLARSFMVGDRDKDVLAGIRAGCRTVILDQPYNREVAADIRILSPEELIPYIR